MTSARSLAAQNADTPGERAPATEGLPAQRLGRPSEGLQYVHRVSRVLSGRPDEQRLLRSLVLDLPRRFHAVTGLLAHCFDDGTLAVTATFGYAEDKVFPSPFPLSEDWPISRAARAADPFCLPTTDEVLRAFPLMHERYDEVELHARRVAAEHRRCLTLGVSTSTVAPSRPVPRVATA